MRVIDKDLNVLLAPCVATIGFFDGVHTGHRYLIKQVKEVAALRGLRSAIVTFPVHPREVMDADFAPQLLTTPDEKLYLLEETEVDDCFMLDFTFHLSQLTARQFMNEILKKTLGVECLVIGYDHRFGHNRSEMFDDYCRYGKQLGIEVLRAHAYLPDQQHISSSMIRHCLHEGDVMQAARALGYPYFLSGTVVGGYQVGRKIGFPTANLRVNHSHKLIPKDGVYAVRVFIDGVTYGGMLNIGHRPTLDNGLDRSIEVHILHFHSNIYDKQIRICFVQRVRSEMKFDGIEALIAQLHRDAEYVENLFFVDNR